MVRAILKDGLIQPIEDLFETWTGQPLVIDAAEPTVVAEEIKAWSWEIAAAAERIPEEEHERFLAALQEVKKESKGTYRTYVRESIEAGLRDADAGRVVSVEEVRARFGLSSKL